MSILRALPLLAFFWAFPAHPCAREILDFGESASNLTLPVNLFVSPVRGLPVKLERIRRFKESTFEQMAATLSAEGYYIVVVDEQGGWERDPALSPLHLKYLEGFLGGDKRYGRFSIPANCTVRTQDGLATLFPKGVIAIWRYPNMDPKHSLVHEYVHAIYSETSKQSHWIEQDGERVPAILAERESLDKLTRETKPLFDKYRGLSPTTDSVPEEDRVAMLNYRTRKYAHAMSVRHTFLIEELETYLLGWSLLEEMGDMDYRDAQKLPVMQMIEEIYGDLLHSSMDIRFLLQDKLTPEASKDALRENVAALKGFLGSYLRLRYPAMARLEQQIDVAIEATLAP